MGEFGLIRHLTDCVRLKNPGTLKGIGDDAAVISFDEGMKALVTTDMQVIVIFTIKTGINNF